MQHANSVIRRILHKRLNPTFSRKSIISKRIYLLIVFLLAIISFQIADITIAYAEDDEKMYDSWKTAIDQLFDNSTSMLGVDYSSVTSIRTALSDYSIIVLDEEDTSTFSGFVTFHVADNDTRDLGGILMLASDVNGKDSILLLSTPCQYDDGVLLLNLSCVLPKGLAIGEDLFSLLDDEYGITIEMVNWVIEGSGNSRAWTDRTTGYYLFSFWDQQVDEIAYEISLCRTDNNGLELNVSKSDMLITFGCNGYGDLSYIMYAAQSEFYRQVAQNGTDKQQAINDADDAVERLRQSVEPRLSVDE